MSSLEIDDENEFDMDDLMDEAAEFDLPDNIDLEMENDDEVAEKTENETKKGGDGLVMFYVATLKFSGSLYVTCNAFFDEMVLIQQAIKKLCATNDSVLYPLARGMSAKFDKYWRNFQKINPMMLYAVVLDPRCKLGFFEYCFLNTLGFDKKLAELLWVHCWVDLIDSKGALEDLQLYAEGLLFSFL
ncbi:hypothetical protein Vadar_019971 [Vaccinium darrowii]|uniref:Uncharacterized protein n=1 Tax=Vaccinium darrowii TaxID=229202 RepID=A0ACB7YN84_9ERIC|nr:hypothetical protein Vadar_019971 [Vaccinium darrowii]